jgi:geranylgeranyl pyrophosphate synthase
VAAEAAWWPPVDAVAALIDERWTGAWPARFVEALRWPQGGKQIRPAIVLAAYGAVTPTPGDLSPALPAAAAVQLVHTYSLVHDDLPSMDDDDERRGRPTVHVAFGEAAAVLVGDALLTEAFAVLVTGPATADRKLEMVAVLAAAAGARGMVAGQAADVGLGGPVADLEALTRLHAGKTGALITACAVLGGLAAGAEPGARAALERWGRAVGLAFQLADDVLDASGDSGDGGPPSFVKLLGVDATRARARALVDEAVDAVRSLPRPETLGRLARFAVDRDH